MLWEIIWICIVFIVVIWVRRLFYLSSVNKVVFISGCDSGFGKLAAIQLSRKGCTILAACLTKDGIQSLKAEKLANLIPIQLDITNSESINNAIKITNEYCEGKGLWALINNAGIASAGVFDLTDMKVYRDILEVNFFGHVEVTQGLLPLLKKSKGRIITTASILGRGFGLPGSGPYIASKRAIEAFNDCLRLELKPWGVSAIVIEPGFMNTPIVENSIQSHTELRRNISKEKLEEYGEVFFNEVDKGFKILPKLLGNPQLVCDAYIHAALAVYPKQRYLVGIDAWLIFSWLALIPSFMADLPFVKQPLPAVLRKK